MKWSIDLAKLHPQVTPTISVIMLLVVVALLNLCTCYSNMSSRTSLLQIKSVDTRTHLQLQAIDADLQAVAQQLQENKALSNTNLKALNTQLAALQTVLAAVPTISNFQQLQTMVAQIQQQLAAQKTVNASNAAHSKKHQAKRYHLHKHLTPTALPFTVSSIDIWNGTTQATINRNGAPDLMAPGDTRFGWTLVTLSFDTNQAVFKNQHDQRVVVHVS